MKNLKYKWCLIFSLLALWNALGAWDSNFVFGVDQEVCIFCFGFMVALALKEGFK